MFGIAALSCRATSPSSSFGGFTFNNDNNITPVSAVIEGVTPSMVDMDVEKEKLISLENTTVLGSFPPLPTQVTTLAGNAPGKRVAYPVVANYVRNAWGEYGLIRSMFNSSTGLFSFQFSSMDGLDVMLENVWVKLHGVPVTTFSKDGLSVIATKLGTPLMLDSYTSDMCMQSWGRSSYARVIIELRADVELKDNIVMAIPKTTGDGHYICNVLSDPKKPTASSNGNKKKCVEPTIEVSNSNLFEVLNWVDNYEELGTNGGTTSLVNNGATSSGSSFMNFNNSSTGTTPIIDKIGKFKELLTSRQAILVDEAGNPLKKVEFLGDYDSEDEVASVDNDMARSMASERAGFGTQSLLEQWKDSYENGDYDEDAYDDDLYEGQDLPDKLQEICNNLDIRVRGRRKKYFLVSL
ncbi:hypothetical protein Tco_0639221 [Tanacetum coccineum]